GRCQAATASGYQIPRLRRRHRGTEQPLASLYCRQYRVTSWGATIPAFLTHIAMATLDASPSERPRHHQRELFLPERVAVRPDALSYEDVRTCIAQRVRPPGRVLEEERLQRAGDEVHARDRARHHLWRSEACARRGGEDRAVDVRMPNADGERELSTRRDTEHRGAFGGQCDSES